MANTRPFKKFYCDRPEVFLLPPAAFKLWTYHYAREGADRKSWPSLQTLCKALDLNESTVKKARRYLIEHGWMEKSGERDGNGAFKVPVFTVRRGTLPQVKKSPMARGGKSTSAGVEKAPPVEVEKAIRTKK